MDDVEQSHQDIIETAKKRYREAISAWGDLRDEMFMDLQFLAGDQWAKDVVSERVADGRPCLTINKLPAFVDQIIGDQLQNRPEIKFLPVDDRSDKDTAEVMTGLRRHIEQDSDADIAYDTAMESAVSCGMGAWRVNTQYVDDESFDQEIKIERIMNRFSVFPDPSAQKWDYSDGQYFFIVEEMDRKLFQDTYPEAAMSEWEDSSSRSEWCGPETQTVAEYFYRKPGARTVYDIMFEDGMREVVTKLPDEDEPRDFEIIRKRDATQDEIWWCKMNGVEILEGPTKIACKLFPIVMLWGKELILDKKRVYRGIVRYAKDAQRLYNYSRSYQAETTALAPKAPFMATPKQLEGHEHQWNTANKKNWPYLLYNPDVSAPGPPQRQFPGQLNTAVQNEIMIADQEIHDTTGLQLASLGKRSNEKSGVAIAARQREGDVGNFAYTMNLLRAMRYTGKILLDLIPKIYDTPRMQRILGPDMNDKIVALNQPYQAPDGKIKMHDLSAGKYDVVTTTGPSYTTKRQEAAASMVEVLRTMPQVAPMYMDLVAKNLDWPGADEFTERTKKLLPPGIGGEEGEGGQPGAVPGAPGQPAQAGPPPVPPEVEANMKAQMMAQRAQQDAAAMQAQIKAEQEKVKLQQEQERLKGIHLDNELKKVKILEAHEPKPPANGGKQPQARARAPAPIESRQFGGPVKEGKPYLVGEGGPEIIVPGQSGQIVPMNQVPLREPSASESDFFRQNQNIAGMAAEDNQVLINPYSNLSQREKDAVVRNEQARVFMRTSGLVPDFELTESQSKAFGGYGSPVDIRQTIAARILSGDPSALDVTLEQEEWVRKNLVGETQ